MYIAVLTLARCHRCSTENTPPTPPLSLKDSLKRSLSPSTSPVMAAGMQLTLEEENCGVMVHLPVDFDVKSEDEMRRLGHTLTPVLVAHNLLHIRQAEPTAAPPSPKCIRAFYSALHAGRYESVPFKPPGDAARTTQDENLRGRSFPGFNETQLLGRADHVEDLHGLSGPIWPRAWWEVRDASRRTTSSSHHQGEKLRMSVTLFMT